MTSTSTRGTHLYRLCTSLALPEELSPSAAATLPDGWRQVRHEEVMDQASDSDAQEDDDQWAAGDIWVHWTIEVDAVMSGPNDRWEADRKFRDLAHSLSGRRPGPGFSWSLRSQKSY